MPSKNKIWQSETVLGIMRLQTPPVGADEHSSEDTMSKKEALSVAVYYHRRILEESCALEGLGTTGAFVHMAQPMPVGSPLVIRFRAEDKGVGPALPCSVTHVEEISSREKSGRSGVALAFEELEEPRMDFLSAILEGTAPQEAGVDFPDEPDFTLPEPPIPGEAVAPAPVEPVSAPNPVPEADSDQSSKDQATPPQPAQPEQQERPAEPENEDQLANSPASSGRASGEIATGQMDGSGSRSGDVATGEIGAPQKESQPETDMADEQPSVVIDAGVPEQLELRGSAAISGEIATQEPAADRQEQPSVVVGELLTEPTEEKAQAKPAAESAPVEKKDNGDETDQPKKKKRRRGRRKKKNK